MTKLSSIHRKVAKSSMFQLLESASFLSLPVEPIKNFHTPTFLEKYTFFLIRLFFKAELPQVGILFGTQFPSLGIFISKKLDFEKTKTT